VAFARYIASIHERNPFTESGPVAVEIQASLPGLYKESRVLAIRRHRGRNFGRTDKLSEMINIG
jgi:hypothetical protein